MFVEERAGVALAGTDVRVELLSLCPVLLQREGAEAELFDEGAQEVESEVGDLVGEAGGFAEGDDGGVADDTAQRPGDAGPGGTWDAGDARGVGYGGAPRVCLGGPASGVLGGGRPRR